MTQAQAADVLHVDKKKDELGTKPKKMHKLSEHTGPNSLLHDIELDLLNFIKEWVVQKLCHVNHTVNHLTKTLPNNTNKKHNTQHKNH